jgi:hypothetical protein
MAADSIAKHIGWMNPRLAAQVSLPSRFPQVAFHQGFGSSPLAFFIAHVTSFSPQPFPSQEGIPPEMRGIFQGSGSTILG